MNSWDLIHLGVQAIAAHRRRTFLSVLGIAIGILAVILLSSLGSSTRDYILDQFTQFGTNILAVTPGKAETVGIPGVLGGTTDKLSLEDAEALRRVPGVEHVVPLAMGQARVEGNGRGRSVFVYGVNSEVPFVWKFDVGQGSFLPAGDARRGAAVAVLGPTLKRELFGDGNALGQWVRVAGTRLRVIGIMEAKGRMLGFDVDDAAYVPVVTAMRMFNLDELNEVDVAFLHDGWTEQVVAGVRRVLMERHDREDFTITTQAAMLDVFGRVLSAVTLAVAAIAGISLLVGGIGILTILWISVGERTHEIGLLRAIGATATQVRRLFLVEAVILALLGGLLGLAAALGLVALIGRLVPAVPLSTPPEFVFAALATSAITGLLSGVIPARRAARLDPIEALRSD